MKLLKNNKGQGMVEYMIIVALMAVATMGIMRVLSHTTSIKIANITQSLQGGKGSVSIKYKKLQKNDYKKKDMSSFFQGSRNTKDK